VLLSLCRVFVFRRGFSPAPLGVTHSSLCAAEKATRPKQQGFGGKSALNRQSPRPIKSASLYSENGAFRPRRCRHPHLWPVTLHKPRSAERFSSVSRRRPPYPGNRLAAPAIPVPPAVYRRPVPRLPRVRPGKPPYTARAPPPGNVPAPRRRARHAAFVGLTRPSPARAPLATRRLIGTPRLPAPKTPAATPGTAPATRRPAKARPCPPRRGTPPPSRRARPAPAQPPPRAAAFRCAPRGDRILRLFRLETAAPSRVNFRKIQGWGY